MSSPYQNIIPYPSNFQGTPALPMPMGFSILILPEFGALHYFVGV
jgi:hypothetical protein